MSYGDQRGPKRNNNPAAGAKRIAPPKHTGRIVNVQKETTVNDVIDNALGIIKQQVDTLAAKSRLGGLLPDHEVKALRTHIQSLVELSREDRERAKHEGVEEYYAQLSTEELVAMAQGRLVQSANMDNALDVGAEVISEERSKDEKE